MSYIEECLTPLQVKNELEYSGHLHSDAALLIAECVYQPLLLKINELEEIIKRMSNEQPT